MELLSLLVPFHNLDFFYKILSSFSPFFSFPICFKRFPSHWFHLFFLNFWNKLQKIFEIWCYSFLESSIINLLLFLTQLPIPRISSLKELGRNYKESRRIYGVFLWKGKELGRDFKETVNGIIGRDWLGTNILKQLRTNWKGVMKLEKTIKMLRGLI